MGSDSVGFDLIQLQNIIDAEFESAKAGGKLCSLLTDVFVDRLEAVKVKQQELKNCLQSLEVQIIRKSGTDVQNIIAGGKDMPIVIDDEEESSERTVEERTDVLITERDTSSSAEISVEIDQEAPQQPEIPDNEKRRPLILEQTPSATQDKDTVEFSEEISEVGRPVVAHEKTLSDSKSTTEEVESSRLSPALPAVSTESDFSTETASSPYTDLSQSSLHESYEAEFDLKESKCVQEVSSTENIPKQPDQQEEISELKNQEMSSSPRPHSPSDFKIGSRVLGKRSSDIWFPGEIMKTMNDRNGQMKYSIKYDKGPKGVLSRNHICPEDPAAMFDLSVGSRVVGLYGNLNIWYAGIVAEMACQGNRNRVLVFFDDGFAQYLSIKKVHKVHHKGQNVWEDVIEDSRDFIREYLEDYPSRPMLHVRVGQWIRTEWKGQWLKARVMNVDGSLVKMLFQIDNRSEWIYRGSTRLDPLYTALVMGEKSRSTKARSRKLTRKTSSKDNAPYIEYNITKPCYGVSPYSKTDPKGIQQSTLEEQRQLTQQQHEGLRHLKQAPRVPMPKNEEKTVMEPPVECVKTQEFHTPPPPTPPPPPPSAPPPTAPPPTAPPPTARSPTARFPSAPPPAAPPPPPPTARSPYAPPPSAPPPTACSPSAPPPAARSPSAPPPSAPPPTAHSPSAYSPSAPSPSAPSPSAPSPSAPSPSAPHQRPPSLPPPPVKDAKPPSIKLEKKEVVVLDDEPVIESTYSCIQASTMRKKTGASLVNNVIFKAVNLKDEEVYSSLPDTPLPSSFKPILAPTATQTFVEQYKPKVKSEEWKAPWLNIQRNKQRHGSTDNVIKPTFLSKKQHDAASILKHKLDAKILNPDIVKLDISSAKRKTWYMSHPVPHTCSFACSRSSSKVSIDPLRHNPLAVPILMDWKREIVKKRGKTTKRDVYYRTPCNRRLRNMTEVIRYLQLTEESSLNVDHFTFDWRVHTDNVLPLAAVVNDISSGQENRPLPAVNEVDGTRPPNIQYMSMRQFAPEVELTTDPGFMVCCDCKDNCSDPSVCACIQLTLQGCKAMDMKDLSKMTYQYRRLKDCIQTGIYECNSECSCTKNCLNRVVQNGIQLRLEVFKTENRGWGLRATDDIPAGTFVCTYAGYILNEELANQDGRKYGDEYMAELDYIEVAEKAKEGYESDVSDLEEDDNLLDDMLQSDDNFSYSGNSNGSRNGEDDEDYDDEGGEEDEADEEDEEDSNVDKARLSSEGEITSSSDDAINKDTDLEKQKRKHKGTSYEESLVVERESKASILSRLGTPMMCILALKRFDNDLKKASLFLKQHARDDHTTTANPKRDNSGTANGVSPQPLAKTGAKSEVPSDCSVPLKIQTISAVPENELRAKDNEKDSVDRTNVAQTSTVKSLSEGKDETKSKTDNTGISEDKTNDNEQIVDPKDDVPELLSADDLQRLAASQPRSLQPPVLTRRVTVLDETIEKLKKRVVNPDLSVLECDYVSENSPSGCFGEMKKESFETSTVSEKKSSCHGDNDDEIENSETSSLSRNSSSTTQSVSSRGSSPAVDMRSRFKREDKTPRDQKRSSEKEMMSTQNSNARYLKTRSLFGEEHCYVIDATFGNCGRFLNHSCSPNLFVQNVFVDTHDMRFPWVAFFAQRNIKAGSELTWDYMYEVGSVRDKSLYCLCGTSGCRGRLL